MRGLLAQLASGDDQKKGASNLANHNVSHYQAQKSVVGTGYNFSTTPPQERTK
jgi:hypothetical protein